MFFDSDTFTFNDMRVQFIRKSKNKMENIKNLIPIYLHNVFLHMIQIINTNICTST